MAVFTLLLTVGADVGSSFASQLMTGLRDNIIDLPSTPTRLEAKEEIFLCVQRLLLSTFCTCTRAECLPHLSRLPREYGLALYSTLAAPFNQRTRSRKLAVHDRWSLQLRDIIDKPESTQRPPPQVGKLQGSLPCGLTGHAC